MTPTTSCSDIEAIDNAIEGHKEALRLLFSQRNSLLPVCRLPTELLSEIFLRHVEDHHAVIRRLQADTVELLNLLNWGHYTWITVTHVCRHWRSVALSFPRLWTDIDCRREDCTAEFLRRSGSVPLALSYRSSSFLTPSPALELALKQIERVRVLKLRLSEFLRQRQAQHIGPFSKAALRHLVELDLTHPTPAFLRSLLRPHLTRLKCARLQPTVDVRAWVDILRCLPALVDLELEGVLASKDDAVLADHDDSHPIADKRVSLPHIERLHLRNGDIGVASAELLRYLSLPPSASIHFHGWCHGDTSTRVHAFRFIFRVIAASLLASGAPLPLSCRAYRGDEVGTNPHFTIDTWPTLRSVDAMNDLADAGDADHAPGHVSMSWGLLFTDLPLLTSFLAAFPLSALRALCLAGPGRAELWPFCTGLDAVTDLAVSYAWPAESLIDVFDQMLVADDARCAACMRLFPRLQCLTLRAVKWSRHPYERDERPLAAALARVLARRAAVGMRVHKLVVDAGVNVWEEDMDALRDADVVDVFEWDGDGGSDRDCLTCDEGEDVVQDLSFDDF